MEELLEELRQRENWEFISPMIEGVNIGEHFGFKILINPLLKHAESHLHDNNVIVSCNKEWALKHAEGWKDHPAY